MKAPAISGWGFSVLLLLAESTDTTRRAGVVPPLSDHDALVAVWEREAAPLLTQEDKRHCTLLPGGVRSDEVARLPRRGRR